MAALTFHRRYAWKDSGKVVALLAAIKAKLRPIINALLEGFKIHLELLVSILARAPSINSLCDNILYFLSRLADMAICENIEQIA
jgi:hypothetical protein